MLTTFCPKCECESIPIKNGNNRLKCKLCDASFNDDALVYKEVEYEQFSGNKFVITCAVSESRAHKPFLGALKNYCEANNAQLMIVPIMYKNPTSRGEHKENEKKRKAKLLWSRHITPYFFTGKAELGHNLLLLGMMPTQPTAARPLSSLQSMGGPKSVIFGHPKVALESVPTRLNKEPKIIVTTGAITHPNYSKSKAGQKGEFHHVIGALVVEINEGEFHVRHIHANKDGSFYDLDKKYLSNGKIEPATIEVLVCGDLHAVKADPVVLEQTFFATDSIVKTLKPKFTVIQDNIDFESASHHNTFVENFKLNRKNRNVVEEEVKYTLALDDKIADLDKNMQLIITKSNHNEHFMTWLRNPIHTNDSVNGRFYNEIKAEWFKALERDEEFDAFAFCGSKWLRNKKQIRFLKDNESFILKDIEFALHGDYGLNGSRGSINSFVNLGHKTVIGHSHTMGIRDGVVQVGTSSLKRMGYNKGLSSWSHSHCIVYKNGKRSLITIVNGKWRLR